jgi:hypothetical protein
VTAYHAQTGDLIAFPGTSFRAEVVGVKFSLGGEHELHFRILMGTWEGGIQEFTELFGRRPTGGDLQVIEGYRGRKI